MLVHMAIGDAFGAGREYVQPDLQPDYHKLVYVRHPSHDLPPGYYTDDTHMAISVALVIWGTYGLGIKLEKKHFANMFVHRFQSDPRTGFSKLFQEFQKTVTDGEDFLARIKSDSDKSGGAMRAPPLGFLPDTQVVIDLARLQASVTHDTPDGRDAAAVSALMAHYFIKRLGPKKDLGDFLNAHVPSRNWAEPWEGKVKSKGWMSVRAAITALMASNSLTEVLTNSVAFTGDVDTVAAIAMGAAAYCDEMDSTIPNELLYKLEESQYGKSYLEKLDMALMHDFGREIHWTTPKLTSVK